MNKIVIIHGLGGLKETYFPHLAETCKKLNLEVFMPTLGSYHDEGGTSYEIWKGKFTAEILPHIDKNTIIVANSLGTAFFVKYFAETKVEIGAYISCAAAYDPSNMKPTAPERIITNEIAKKTIASFVPKKEEFKAVKSIKCPKWSFFSDNDRFFFQENLENYSKSIGSKATLLKGKNHFDMTLDGEPFTNFTELEDLITQISK